MSKHRILGMIIPLLAVISLGRSQGPDLKSLLDLSGNWKFELGDNTEWSKPEFDDSKWDLVYVPSPWEEEGYPGYDGYAWYRKHFRVDARFREKPLYLRLGNVDDVGEAYLNGHMIGYVGTFPPDYYTGYGVDFRCLVPQDFLRDGSDNVIAVRIYDDHGEGGITRGNVGFCQPRSYVKPSYDLSGLWKFKTGDSKSWAESSYDDSHWQELKVPLMWDAQGYKDYDGFAWYRVKFKVPAELVGKRLILLLGKIDDNDETYLNGELIGRTGGMRRRFGRDDLTSDYEQLRAYSIPPSLLIPDQENTIAVRVLDVWMHGGIYDGPIGLIERSRYRVQKERPRTFWDALRQLFD